MITSQVYSEVYEILNTLGKEYISKIPIKLYQYIESQRDKKSIVEFDVNKDIASQGISEEAADIISYLNLEYWSTEEQKKELIKQYQENDKKYEEKLKEKYNTDNLFKKEKYIDTNKRNLIKTEKKQSLFSRILKKIKGLFK